MADIDDLKATFEQVVSAICRRDASAYSALWDEQIVAFPPFSPFALEGKAMLRQAAETNFANAESVSFSPINPQCRVVGQHWNGRGPPGVNHQAQGRPAQYDVRTLHLHLCQDRRAMARGIGARFADSVRHLKVARTQLTAF
jgi:ketosteroid isomerase-like protein